jgi:hypothetical protein
MQNDTKKILFNASNFYSFSKEKNDADVLLLGNREIDKRYANIYKKYLRKHIAQYALTVGNTEDKSLEKRRLQKHLLNAEFKLKRKNDAILKKINQTLCSCGRDTHFQNVSGVVDIKETATTRRLKGLKSCGNNSACPVCASKLSAVRGNQLKQLMDVGRKNGRSYMMIVSTIQHTPNEVLEITLNQVIDMSNFIFNQREYKKFKKLTKCRFVHGGLENMVSFKNGLLDWHPHKNYLLDFDISIEEVIKNLGLSNELELRMYVSRMMTSLGQKYLDKNGIEKTLLFPRFEPDLKSKRIYIKAGVSASLEFDDGYIAKWGLDAEMTSGIYKDGRFSESFHPFNLLDFIHQDNQETTKEQKYQCIKAFQEFVLASKGKWWFYFGRGAVAYYNELYGAGLKVKKDDEELLTLEDDGELIYFLSNQEWLDFEPTPKKVGFALSLSTRQDVLEYIFEHIESNRIKKMILAQKKIPTRIRAGRAECRYFFAPLST